MEALFIVDMQNDFVLDIPYMDKSLLVNVILEKIKTYKEKELPIITTMDSHIENHYEFLKHGKHCIIKSDGEQLYIPIKKALEDYNKWYVVKKNSYSSFLNTNMYMIMDNLNITKAEVCGVLTSVCILNLVFDLVNRQIPVNIIPFSTFDYEDKNMKALIIMKDLVGVTNE